MWKEFVQRHTDKCEFTAPSTVDQLDDAESRLGVGLPEDLRGLLLETDGVVGEYGEGVIWPLKRIVEENLSFRANAVFRELYMPFDHLLFFGDYANGDQFAFPIQADGVMHRLDVFVWMHEEDSRNWVASSVRDYLDRLLSGKIEL